MGELIKTKLNIWTIPLNEWLPKGKREGEWVNQVKAVNCLMKNRITNVNF